MPTTLRNTDILFNDGTTQSTGIAIGFKQVYSGVLLGGGPYSANGQNYIFTILYTSGNINSREYVSPDEFFVMTTLNDFYTVSGAATWQKFNSTKTVYIPDSGISAQSKFGYNIKSAPYVYPVPYQINLRILVPTSSSVNSLTYDGSTPPV